MNKVETVELGVQPVEVAPDNSAATVALGLLAVGSSMAVAGVYILCGAGWALIAGALPVLFLAMTMFRGLKRGA